MASAANAPFRLGSSPVLPPLVSGDHLSRPEFERRYQLMRGSIKAELIEGKVHMSPPVAFESHGSPHLDLVTWLGVYRASTPGVRAGDNVSLRLSLSDMPQPDACLFVDADHGGLARISDDDFIEGAPDFVAEIAASTASHDLHEKLSLYQRNGVREYVVWRTYDRAIDYFVLRDKVFVRLAPDDNGRFRSTAFPGLWLDAPSLLSGELSAVLSFLHLGAASQEHAAFVVRLKETSQPR
jgi:Uma2 family endonuclease